MTSGRGAAPLPPPPPPADSACAISQAAQAATRAWAPPMDPAGHCGALSQLHSILRDLGIAIRGLARYQTTGYPADAPPPDFPQHIAASAERLITAVGFLAAAGRSLTVCAPRRRTIGLREVAAILTGVTARLSRTSRPSPRQGDATLNLRRSRMTSNTDRVATSIVQAAPR